MKKHLGLSIQAFIMIVPLVLMFVMMSCFFFRAPASAGSLEPSGSPSDSSTRMYSLEQIYQLAGKGQEPVLATSFSNPASGPGSTFHTLTEVCDLLKTKFSACNATANDVLAGKYFFATQMTSDGTGTWGPTVGRYRPPHAPTGNATEGDVLLGRTFSNSSGTGKIGSLVLPSGGGLLKTGQTTAYHAAAPNDLGDDGVLQEGAAFDYTDNGDNTVTDNVTGLMWIADHTAIDITGTGYDWTLVGPNSGKFVWSSDYGPAPDAFTAIADMNAANYRGHNDWRLPNCRELESLVDRGVFNPSIHNSPTIYFPNTQSDGYWSSTTNAALTDYAWYVYFYFGYVSYGYKDRPRYVRPVRGGE